MLQKLVQEALMKIGRPEVETSTIRIIKDAAKDSFFRGNLPHFVDYIFDHQNDMNPSIEKQLLEHLAEQQLDTAFLNELKHNIQSEIASKQLDKNTDGLLEILGYGHLKPFLTLFKK